MNLILLGPPGAGKGTQSKRVSKNFNLIQISTGDLLRNEIKLETELGKEIESLINYGSLISDNIVNKLIEKTILNHKNFNKFIFDGYPRTIPQIKSLETLLTKSKQKISVVISLNVERETIIKRINGRIACNSCNRIFNLYFDPPNKENHDCDEKYLIKRSDDNSKVLINRFETYMSKTKPVLDYYKKLGLIKEIDGNRKIDEIYNKISDILANIRD